MMFEQLSLKGYIPLHEDIEVETYGNKSIYKREFTEITLSHRSIADLSFYPTSPTIFPKAHQVTKI